MARPDNPFADSADMDDVIRRAMGEAPPPAAARGPAAPPFDDALFEGGRGAPPPGQGPRGADPFGFDAPREDPFGPNGAGANGRADPFGLGGPSGFPPRRASPLGLLGDDAPAGVSLRRGEESLAEQAFELAAINPLVGVASALLWLAARLNETDPVEDVGALRRRVVEEMGRFETAAMTRGVPPRLARVARYALCATIDDIVLNTDWGRQTDWPGKSLVGIFYQETWGGERFFDLLGQLHQQPDENIDALELMALCLSIGFVGKYRVMDGGAVELGRLRAQLYRTIRSVRGPQEWSLATAFQAVAAPYRPPARMIWFWVASAAALALLILFYLYLGVALDWRLDAAKARVAAVVPATPILVDAPAVPTVPDPVPPPAAPAGFGPAPGLTQLQRISAVLQPEIASGDVEVVADGGDIAIRMLRASFPTGGATLARSETPVVRQIAAALNPEPGPITVVGHTDNRPVAGRRGNNDTLSRDRAASAAAMLRPFLTDATRVSSAGRGDTLPIASNDTADGRARNRRVEFRILAEKAAP